MNKGIFIIDIYIKIHKQPISTRKNNRHHYSPGKCKNERLLNASWDDYDFKRKIARADKGVGKWEPSVHR